MSAGRTRRALPWLLLALIAAAVAGFGVPRGCNGNVAAGGPHRQSIRLHRLGSASVRPDEPVNILLIGSDRRSEPINQSRADAIMLVRLNPRTSRAMLLSFPRDSYINIPGHGEDKMNAALSIGGPRLVAQTISQYSGIKLDYYAATDFWRFVRIVGKMEGGVWITIKSPIFDPFAGAALRAGHQRLRPGQALAFVRSRHIGDGDFTRAAHQQQFVKAVFNQETRDKNPFRLLRLVKIFSDEMETDLTAPELVDLARIVFSIKSKRVVSKVLDGEGVYRGSASVVILDQDKAQKDFERFKGI